MANEFSIFELRLVKNLWSSLSNADIADMLSRPVKEVTDLIRDMNGGLSPFEKNAQKVTHVKEVKKAEKKRVFTNIRAKKDQEKARKDFETSESRKVRKIIAHQNAERAQKRRQQEKPLHKTKEVDYSKLISIRIDQKTIIYAKPGQDINEVKKKYFERLKASKSRTVEPEKMYKEVKKFKPTN